jgi:ribosome-associated translation inhibitor RaiA/cold shock CspA family protein
MQLPLEIVFRNLERSPAIEAKVRARAEKLDHYCKDIMRCQVVIEGHHKHHHKGNLYRVRLDVTVPGDELVVSREPGEHHAHEDAYVAVRDSFDAMTRQLEDYVRRRRGKIKTHETPLHGRIVELLPKEDYGRIETSAGRLIYFHRNSVIDADLNRLQIGDQVHFAEEMGESGPQASTVHVEGKHHITE